MKFRIILSAFILLTYISCRKDLPADSPFIGTWVYNSHQEDTIIRITINEDAAFYEMAARKYVNDPPEFDTIYDGKAAIKKGNLYIDTYGKWKITQMPDGKTMGLDDKEFIKNGTWSPSCNDGRINQGEKGYDCGGPCGEICFEEATFNYQDTLNKNIVVQSYSADAARYYSNEFHIYLRNSVAILSLKFPCDKIGPVNPLSTTYLYYNSTQYFYQTGNINITELDMAHRRISGTFQFQAKDTSNNGIPLVENISGTFKKLKFKVVQ